MSADGPALTVAEFSDGTLWGLHGASWTQVPVPAGPGPAPGTSTDKAIVRWNGTTGMVIQNGVAIESDVGAITTADGTNLLPVYSFTSEPSSGILRAGAGNVGISILGTTRVAVQASLTSFTSGYRLEASGTNSVLIFGGQQTSAVNGPMAFQNQQVFAASTAVEQTGVRIIAGVNQTGTASFAALKFELGNVIAGTGTPVFGSAGGFFIDALSNSVSVFQVTAAGASLVAAGTNALPTQSFLVDVTKGFYSSGANQIGVAIAGTLQYSLRNTSIIIEQAGTWSIGCANSGTGLNFSGRQSTAVTPLIVFGNGAIQTGGAGVNQVGWNFASGVNQTGTASWVGIKMDPSVDGADGGAPVFGSGGGFFFDLQTNATSQLKITATGRVQGTGAAATPGFTAIAFPTTGMFIASATNIGFAYSGSLWFQLTTSGTTATIATLNTTTDFYIENGQTQTTARLVLLAVNGGTDTYTAANVAYCSNFIFTGSTAQQRGFGIYPGVNQTSTATFTALDINATASALGGGSTTPVFGSGGGFAIKVATGGTAPTLFASLTFAGVWSTRGENPQASATYDLGTNALLWRDIYLSGSVRGGNSPITDKFFSGLFTGAAGAVTNYAGDGGVGTATAVGQVGYPMPRAVRLKNLYFAPIVNTLAGSLTATIYKNNVATAVTITVTAASTAVQSDTTHTADFAVGDKLDLVVVETGIGAMQFSATVEVVVV